MIEKNSKRFLAAAIAIILLFVSVFGVLTLILNLYVALVAIVIMLALIPVGYFKLSVDTRKKINENIFIIITGAAALVMVAFVIYILSDIFWSAKSHLTLDFLLMSPEGGLTEGGIYPAIIGTALLVIIMAVVGVPFGTLTAIYLTEYAKDNSIIARFIRFAINTLAGVPAIVFGLFGLGFFINSIGQTIDTMEHNKKMEEAREIINADGSPFMQSKDALIKDLEEYFLKNNKEYWSEQVLALKAISETRGNDATISKKELIERFDSRQKPKWGQPALIWAALTMALLTLPVVIVSVEEALKAVPRDMREASLALGATKFATIRKVVIPSSITGILTGTILAVSRGAGEVAPILFTGAAYYLPDLPNSLNSQFMELGYHIYILTTQSTNVAQTLPLQYATTFVLLALTFALNFSAIFIRSKMRKKLNSSK